jgi:UDP-glucose 4-epimerase
MTVLLTGGLGAIGSWALRALIERGERPVVLEVRADLSLVADLQGQFDLELGDILEPWGLVRLGQQYGVDRICHLAALMPPACRADPALGFRVNTVGVLQIMELARTLGVKRVVWTSSKAVYGTPAGKYAHPEYAPIPEEHPYDPSDTYGATKVAGEQIAREMAKRYGLELVILRLTSTYGPGKLERHGDVAWLSRMVEEAHAGRLVQVPRGGDEQTDNVYNRDVGNAVALAAFAAHPRKGVYNIGTGEIVSLRQAADVIQRELPNAQIKLGGGIGLRDDGRATGSLLAHEAAAEELGFLAQYSLEAGIRDYLRWLDPQAAASGTEG